MLIFTYGQSLIRDVIVISIPVASQFVFNYRDRIEYTTERITKSI